VEDFSEYFPCLKIFCSEHDRFQVKEIVWRYFPVIVGKKIITEKHDYREYHQPRFTFRDHLRDCFGWLV
jgi:hypothetical protein